VSSTSHDDVVRDSFTRQVSLFSGRESPFAQRPTTALSWIEPLHADMVVLDVACGAAHASEPIAPHVRQVVGLDLTPALLQLGAARLRANGVSNVLLQEGNAHALPFVDDSFDITCCRSSLHHFDEPARAIAEMIRVTKPGGRVVLVDLIAPDGDATRARFDNVHRLLDPSHVRTYTEAELVAMLPGGRDSIVYASGSGGRLPIDIAITEQSARDDVLAALRAEIAGDGPSTGFEPADEDGKLVVTFATCIMHARVD
jgi:ubiquinone/menaquinone biosynthesis C-methylase UbiE